MLAPRLWGLAALVAMLLAATSAKPANLVRQGASEYAVKAAYVLLFTRYVHWPANVFESPQAPIVVLILGKDVFGSVLDETLQSASSHGRALVVRRATTLSDHAAPHVVLFGEATPEQQRAWLAQLQNTPVLTIAEEEGALRHDTVLTFVTQFRRDEARVRFNVNLNAMRRAGLQIDSQMLSAANDVLRAGLTETDGRRGP